MRKREKKARHQLKMSTRFFFVRQPTKPLRFRRDMREREREAARKKEKERTKKEREKREKEGTKK